MKYTFQSCCICGFFGLYSENVLYIAMEGKFSPKRVKQQECPTAYSVPVDTDDNELYSKLLKLELINKQANVDADQVLCILKTISNEYTAANMDAQMIPKMFQVSMDTLSDSSKKSLRYLSEQALLFQQYKESVCVNNKRERGCEQLSKEKSCIQKEIDFLKGKTTDCKHEMNELERKIALTKKEVEDMNIEVQDMESVESEILVHKELLTKLQMQLKEINVNETIYPEVILGNLRELLNMKTDVDTLKMHLQMFDELPPDLLQAKKALSNAKLRECELSQKIASNVLK